MRRETLILSRQMKMAQRYANTARSEGTVTRGLVQGPGAPAGLELRPPAAGEATGRGILGWGDWDTWAAQGSALLAVNTKSLEYFNNQNVRLGVFWLKSALQERIRRNTMNTWAQREAVASAGYQKAAWGVVQLELGLFLRNMLEKRIPFPKGLRHIMEKNSSRPGLKQNRNKNKYVSGASLDRTHIQEFCVCTLTLHLFVMQNKTNKNFTERFA